METMKMLIPLLFLLGSFVDAKPSHPIYPGVGAIYHGPNSATIIKGPDGSVITSEAAGGSIAIDGHNSLVEAAAASSAAAAAAHSISAHQIIDQSAVVAAAAQSSNSLSLSQSPIVVQEAVAPVAVAQPVVIAQQPVLVGQTADIAALEGPSGSIVRHGENAIISGPASTTIRDGNVIADIRKPELTRVIVEPAQTLVAPQAAVVTASIPVNVAEINSHLNNVNLINGANIAAAQISEANRAAIVNDLTSQALAADFNAAAVAEANRAAIQRSQQEAIAQANLQAQARANLEAQAQARANLEVQASLEAQARANLEAQAGLEAQARANYEAQASLEAQANLEAQLANSAAFASQANLNAQLVQAADANAINSAVLAHSQEAIARTNLEAQLEAERNAVAAHRVVSLRPGLNPLITQGNQIISDAVISSSPAPVFEVTSGVSSFAPIVSTTYRPAQNVIVASTGNPIAATPIITHPTAVLAPVTGLNGGQVVYQSSSSSSSQAESRSSSSAQRSSVNIVGGGIGGIQGVVGGHLVAAPVGVASSDYAQWQESFSNSGQSASEAAFATKVHGGRHFIH